MATTGAWGQPEVVGGTTDDLLQDDNTLRDQKGSTRRRMVTEGEGL